MDVKQAKAEVSSALVEIAEQLETILNHKGKIPQIELDLILTNTQRLYSFLVTLSKLNAAGKGDLLQATEAPAVKQEELAKIIQSEVGKLRDEMFRTFSSPSKTNAVEPAAELVSEPVASFPPPAPNHQTGPSPEKLAAIKQNPFIGKTIMPNGEVANKLTVVETVVEVAPVVEQKVVAPVIEVVETKVEEPIVNKVEPPVVVQQEVMPVVEMTPPTPSYTTTAVMPPPVQHTVNEVATDNTLANSLRVKPIASIKAAIGINEKFQYLNDLFKGNVQDYNESLDSLNNFKNMPEAEAHFNQLRQKFGWDLENSSAAGLYELVVRRYLN